MRHAHPLRHATPPLGGHPRMSQNAQGVSDVQNEVIQEEQTAGVSGTHRASGTTIRRRPSKARTESGKVPSMGVNVMASGAANVARSRYVLCTPPSPVCDVDSKSMGSVQAGTSNHDNSHLHRVSLRRAKLRNRPARGHLAGSESSATERLAQGRARTDPSRHPR